MHKLDETVAADVRMKITTALELLHDGMPCIAQDWLYKAADTLQEANENRRQEAGCNCGDKYCGKCGPARVGMK